MCPEGEVLLPNETHRGIGAEHHRAADLSHFLVVFKIAADHEYQEEAVTESGVPNSEHQESKELATPHQCDLPACQAIVREMASSRPTCSCKPNSSRALAVEGM